MIPYLINGYLFKRDCAEHKKKVIDFTKKLTDIQDEKIEHKIPRTSYLESFFVSYEKERKEWFKSDDIIIELMSDSISKANKIVERVKEEIYHSSQELGQEILRIREKRQRKIIKYTVIGGLIPGILYILFPYFKPVDQPIGTQIIVGIVVSLISALILYFWTTRNIRTGRDEEQARTNTIKHLNKTYKSIVESVLHSDNDKIDKLSKIQNALTREWNHRVDTLEKCDFMIQKEKEYNNVKENYERFFEICRYYTNLVDIFCNKYCKYFSDREKNLKALKEITDEIKQSAITPSFDMLQSIEKDLLDLKKEIENVQHS